MIEQPVVHPERPGDHPAIRRVVRAAFESDSEADLVERIRASEGYIPDLSVVAVADGEIVGHAMISRVGLVDGTERRVIHSLAPGAVAPEHQGKGAGGLLVRTLVRLADERGLPLVTVEGSPAYYGRFGFEPAGRHGIHMALPEWAPPEAAQVILLRRYDPALTGRVVYPAAFDEE